MCGAGGERSVRWGISKVVFWSSNFFQIQARSGKIFSYGSDPILFF